MTDPTPSGTADDPIVVDWDIDDPEDPYNWSPTRKWSMVYELAAGTLCVSFASSAYSGGITYTIAQFHISQTTAVLGISLYVLGFGIGPLVFAPLSEMYGRRIVFLATYLPFTLLHLGGALAPNVPTLLATRFLAGTFGSSPLTNAGGTIADMFRRSDLGTASAIYSAAPFLGPVIGPIVGGYVADSPLGWRFNFWIMLIFSALNLLLGLFDMPETYGPTLLRQRATKLHVKSGNTLYYITKYDHRSTSLSKLMCTNLSRPFLFLLTEPIVTLLSIYISFAYATVYAFFAAFPLVFQTPPRHFTPAQTGLAFLGLGVGIASGMAVMPIQNRLYRKAVCRAGGKAPPEARLYLAMVGAVLMPIGLFIFAWTSSPPTSPILPILASIPFGAGIAQILQCLTAYLIDAYTTLFCASALASTVVLRSAVAAAFPLFVPALYARVGEGWAGSVFAGLATLCLPVPFLFFKYGARIRARSKFAAHDDVVVGDEVREERDVEVGNSGIGTPSLEKQQPCLDSDSLSRAVVVEKFDGMVDVERVVP